MKAVFGQTGVWAGGNGRAKGRRTGTRPGFAVRRRMGTGREVKRLAFGSRKTSGTQAVAAEAVRLLKAENRRQCGLRQEV